MTCRNSIEAAIQFGNRDGSSSVKANIDHVRCQTELLDQSDPSVALTRPIESNQFGLAQECRRLLPPYSSMLVHTKQMQEGLKCR